ncbi:MAG: ThuA domain-containing protein [Bryobacterales bacterium]|nr:ThuA domain-containing protein [Bryobacterales bacterium]
MRGPRVCTLAVALVCAAFAQQSRTPDVEAAARILGWRAALDDCASSPSLAGTVDRAAAASLKFAVACAPSKKPDAAQIAAAKSKADAANIKFIAVRASKLNRAVAELASALGAEMILAPAINKSVEGVAIAIPGTENPTGDAKSGLQANAAQWQRAKVKLEGKRLLAVDARDVPEALLIDFMNEAYRLDLKPVWLVSAESAKVYARAATPIAGYHSNYASRTRGVRREGGVSAEEKALIEKAIPDQAMANPKKPRKLLVVDSNIGRRGHPSIPHANLAMEWMAKKTGAFDVVFSNDPEMWKPEKLKQFDAVYLNNTIGEIFPTAEAKASFQRYIEEGGGLVANHAVTVTATEWPEFGTILGARGAAHRMADEKVRIRVEDPASPIVKVFEGQSFDYSDEIFRFQPPYSRDKVRVLLSVDLANTDMNQGKCFGTCFRDDNDYPIAWIRQHGKGRVFYTTLGHNPYVFWEPRMVRMFLGALQYVMGDLESDSTPRPAPSAQ